MIDDQGGLHRDRQDWENIVVINYSMSITMPSSIWYPIQLPIHIVGVMLNELPTHFSLRPDFGIGFYGNVLVGLESRNGIFGELGTVEERVRACPDYGEIDG